jgi:enoyl-CoA hydratase
MTGELLVREERPLAGCALLTLNRPQASNALSLALRSALVEAIRRCAADSSVRVLVLTGAGRNFCAGLDLRELGGAADPSAALIPDESNDPVRALRAFAGPVIGAVNGAAITGGFELALACDVLLAASDARFADTHAKVGVIPGWGLSQLLARRIGAHRAKELSLTGDFLDAARADAWGLVNRVVPAAELLAQALQLARAMLGVQPALLVQYKRLIDEGLQGSLREGLALEHERSRQWAAGLQSDAVADAGRRVLAGPAR